MTDADRIARATLRGSRMLGPVERQRCPRHPRRWVSYRWTWRAGSSIEDGDTETVRDCTACVDEERSSEALRLPDADV